MSAWNPSRIPSRAESWQHALAKACCRAITAVSRRRHVALAGGGRVLVGYVRAECAHSALQTNRSVFPTLL